MQKIRELLCEILIKLERCLPDDTVEHNKLNIVRV